VSYVDPAAATVTAGVTAPPATTPAPAGLNQLDNTQTFLNLLVAQLKNQNPDNPTDPTAFMTEIAQLTAVQSQTTLNAEEQTVAADSMIGRDVSGQSSNGKAVSGTVSAVVLSAAGPPQLELGAGGPSVALDAVTRVYTATAGPDASTSSTTAA
jgi:flagellar basal-body rod modification protein FlgD